MTASIPSSVPAWLAAVRERTILADLSHNALLAVSGDDATGFLHGQLTNEVQSLPVGAAQWTGWCTPKGRLLATFLLVKRPGEYLLMLPAELAAPIAKRLRMFVLRSKVAIADVSDRYARLGLAGTTAGALVAQHLGPAPAPMRTVEHDGAVCVAIDAERFLIFAEPTRAAALREALGASTTAAEADAWEWSLVQAGIPTIVARTQEQFVPQMANFELVGGVSFKKGCYPGQEIVARMQYRGGLKRRMARVHLAEGERPQPGDAVFAPSFGEQAAGMVVTAAPSPEGGFDALVVAQIESLERDELRLGSPEGSRLEVRSRPPSAA